MARRRTSLIDDIFDSLQQLPWWVGVIVAGIFWTVAPRFLPPAGGNATQDALRPIFTFILKFMAVMSLVAAAVSVIKSLSRRKLLNRQSGIDSLRDLSWREFEHLVGEAYRRQGYDIEETGGGGADGGIDLVLRGHGETVLVQCKQWKARQVGVDKVRELFGVVTAERAARGTLVTSGHFTSDAQAFARGKPLTLVDGPALAELVRHVQRGPGPAPAQPPRSLPSQPDCPQCGSTMVLRTARRGANAGSQFYGCSRYPQCRGMRPAT